MRDADVVPDEVTALTVEADRLLWHGGRDRAVALAERALTLNASVIQRYEIGEVLLRASNCRRGWDLYDLHPSRPVDQLPRVARWRGEPCQLLVVVADQGFGDALQFLRFIPRMAGRVDELVMAIHDELFDVVRGCPVLRGLRVIPKSMARRTRWPAHARWERLLSLPARIPNFHVGAADAYLRVDPSPGWALPWPRSEAVTVGVAWKTTIRRGFPNRSIPARIMARLTRDRRIRAVSLHRNRDVRGLPNGVVELPVDDFTDTVRLVGQCDWVVTADTVTAHLAAALGVPTIICLLHRPDWRWGVPSHPTRWYSAAHLLFQDDSHDWRPVVAAAAERIADRMEAT